MKAVKSNGKTGRKVSVGRVHQLIKKYLPVEHYKMFYESLPADLLVQAVASGDVDAAIGAYIIADELQDYLTCDSIKRRKIAFRAIRNYLIKYGIPVPEIFQKVPLKDARRGSKMNIYMDLLARTETLIKQVNDEKLQEYLAMIQKMLNDEINRIKRNYESIKKSASKKKSVTKKMA